MKMNQVLEASQSLGFLVNLLLQTICSKANSFNSSPSMMWRRQTENTVHCCIVDSAQKLEYVARDCHLKAPGPFEIENRIKLPLKFTQENSTLAVLNRPSATCGLVTMISQNISLQWPRLLKYLL